MFAEVLPADVSPRSHVYGTVDEGATLYTDSAPHYKKLGTEYKHQVLTIPAASTSGAGSRPTRSKTSGRC